MFDIVIPYKEDVHKGLELRYCLRSIEKYLTGYGRVLIIGQPPNWYTGESLPSQDFPGRKEYSIYNKILAACSTDISEDFLFYNDDHVLLSPISVTDIKYWHNGLLLHELKRRIGGRYRLVVQNTMELLGNGHPNNYDIHVPIIYNKARFQELFNGLKQEVCIKSVYCNQVEGLPVEYMEDCKIDGQFVRSEILATVEGKTFFSTGTSLCSEMVEVLGELYPNKSKFEI